MLIAVDHGNKQIKTVHCEPFVSGLLESTTRPFGRNILKYRDKFYSLSNQRIPYKRDKTEDERFFVLTLFGIAEEILKWDGCEEETMHIQLAVGLPPAHYGAQYRAFLKYFSGRGLVNFDYRGNNYAIYIDDVKCYPQAYAAAVTRLKELIGYPRVLIADIGGFTADYLLMRNGECDLSVCDSLENGIIVLYNRIRTKVNSEFNVLLDEADIDAVLKGQGEAYSPVIASLIIGMAQDFVNDLFSSLRERMIDLSAGVAVFVGGGAILLKKQIEASGKVGRSFFVNEINANARGYELLYQAETIGR